MSSNVINIHDKQAATNQDLDSYDNGGAYTIIDLVTFSNNRINNVTDAPIVAVLVEDNMGKQSALIGNGYTPQQVADWGTHLTKSQAEGMFGCGIENFKER